MMRRVKMTAARSMDVVEDKEQNASDELLPMAGMEGEKLRSSTTERAR